VFEIGSSLRDARVRQKLALSDAERATHIRARYLAALEDERFELLPEPAYAKGFLREYADYLGLDGQQFVDEYNLRFAPAAEPTAAPPARFRRRPLTRDPRVLALPVAVILVLLGWRLVSAGGGHEGELRPPPPPPRTRATTPAAHKARHTVHRPSAARLVLVATRGRCWLSVRIGSQTGRLVYEQTLEQGRSARFTAKRLWIRLGAPWNLDAILNGRRARLPGTIGDAVVTPAGVNAAPAG
jgi:cytoskeleton protein RodZ